MFRLKKIDLYVFKRFFTLFLMTFLICIFILLMQFLWKHVAELVGKGVEWAVLGEFFIYAIFSLVPMALPLAILLASLMTFGNLGETFELTAMKAAGISLLRIMRPLILFISMVCVGAFYFSNHVLPYSQTKLWTLIFSLRQKSPDFDIPVGEFYSGISGVNFNIYVREKDKRLLKDLMIYDFSGGFDNATVMVADSGRVQFTADNKYLLLSLYDGESFENLKKQRVSSSSSSIPYRRETFKTKEILMDLDQQFTRFDESLLQDTHVSKNMAQLTQSIDSVSKIAEAQGSQQANEIVRSHYLGRETSPGKELKTVSKMGQKKYNADSLFLSLDQESMLRASASALEQTQRMKDQIQYNKVLLDQPVSYVRSHQIERNRKFTLSFACLIFFFIGTPLGAIIRKGGLGAPVVISVLMFIIYYIIDNTGYKMAREGLWSAFEGMWLSSAILLPVGIFLTYKAVIDATIINQEKLLKLRKAIKYFFKKVLNKSTDAETGSNLS